MAKAFGSQTGSHVDVEARSHRRDVGDVRELLAYRVGVTGRGRVLRAGAVYLSVIVHVYRYVHCVDKEDVEPHYLIVPLEGEEAGHERGRTVRVGVTDLVTEMAPSGNKSRFFPQIRILRIRRKTNRRYGQRKPELREMNFVSSCLHTPIETPDLAINFQKSQIVKILSVFFMNFDSDDIIDISWNFLLLRDFSDRSRKM